MDETRHLVNNLSTKKLLLGWPKHIAKNKQQSKQVVGIENGEPLPFIPI
jgi:hypothetical protein